MAQKSRINAVNPEFITVFALISRPGSAAFLVGGDKNNLTAIPGGKMDIGETDPFRHTLGREVHEEVHATLNPAEFGKREYKVNLVLAHARAIVFCTDTVTEELVKNPLEHARKGGNVKLRIVYRMLDVSPRMPTWRDVAEVDFHNPEYRQIRPDEPGMRKALSITLQLAELQPRNWLKPDRYNPGAPIKFGAAHLQSCLNGLSIDRYSIPWLHPQKGGYVSPQQCSTAA